MNRLKTLFDSKSQEILNIYFTAGYPKLDDTVPIILALDKAGADLIEIGMPYSDPLADGPTIQESGQAALENGMTLHHLFDQIKEARQQTEIPLIMMGYFNQVMQFGEEAFFRKCREVGVDGLILPDLPIYVYEENFQELFEEIGLDITFLITPQTSEERIRQIDDLSKSFIYMVSNASITGAKKGISDKQLAYFNRINEMQLVHPRLIGFGISNHETFKTACSYAGGAIIGSAFIKALAGTNDIEQTVTDFIGRIKNSPKAVAAG
ncbi:MAG: tryptophan synthase subunit alpha [Bacteroidota bacterium]